MPSKIVPANETITYKIYHLGRVAPSALDFMENNSPFFWPQKRQQRFGWQVQQTVFSIHFDIRVFQLKIHELH